MRVAVALDTRPIERDALAEGEPDSRRRAEFGGIALLFAEQSGHKDLWKAKLEGWNVEESTVVREWVAQGRAEAARTLVLRLGAKRFGRAPGDIEAAVRGVNDSERLERIAERVMDATDWADLLATK